MRGETERCLHARNTVENGVWGGSYISQDKERAEDVLREQWFDQHFLNDPPLILLVIALMNLSD